MVAAGPPAPLLARSLGRTRPPGRDGEARRGGTSPAAASGGALGSGGALAGSVGCAEESSGLVGGRTRAVGLVLRLVRRRRARCGVVAGGRPAAGDASPRWWLVGWQCGPLRGLCGRRAAPCFGGGRRLASLFLNGDIRRRCWLPPASGESAPWVVMAVVELLRSAGGGGGSLLGVCSGRPLCSD
jgi:hypothetical protein